MSNTREELITPKVNLGPTAPELMLPTEVNEQEYKTQYTLSFKHPNKVTDAKGDVTAGMCWGYEEDKDLTPEEMRGQLMATFNFLTSYGPERHPLLLIHLNPQNPEGVDRQVSANKDLLMHSKFKNMIYCVSNSHKPLDKQKAGYSGEFDGTKVHIADFRLRFGKNWNTVYDYVNNLLVKTHAKYDKDFDEKVTIDAERIAKKNHKNLDMEWEEALKLARNTVITEDVFLLLLMAKSGTQVNLINSQHEGLFLSYQHLNDKKAKKLGFVPNSLKHGQAAFTTLDITVDLEEPKELKNDLVFLEGPRKAIAAQNSLPSHKSVQEIPIIPINSKEVVEKSFNDKSSIEQSLIEDKREQEFNKMPTSLLEEFPKVVAGSAKCLTFEDANEQVEKHRKEGSVETLPQTEMMSADAPLNLKTTASELMLPTVDKQEPEIAIQSLPIPVENDKQQEFFGDKIFVGRKKPKTQLPVALPICVIEQSVNDQQPIQQEIKQEPGKIPSTSSKQNIQNDTPPRCESGKSSPNLRGSEEETLPSKISSNKPPTKASQSEKTSPTNRSPGRTRGVPAFDDTDDKELPDIFITSNSTAIMEAQLQLDFYKEVLPGVAEKITSKVPWRDRQERRALYKDLFQSAGEAYAESVLSRIEKEKGPSVSSQFSKGFPAPSSLQGAGSHLFFPKKKPGPSLPPPVPTIVVDNLNVSSVRRPSFGRGKKEDD